MRSCIPIVYALFVNCHFIFLAHIKCIFWICKTSQFYTVWEQNVLLFYSILFKACNIFLCLSSVIYLTLKWTFYFQMNGVTNGSDPGLALQGLTVQGSNNNNNPDNRPVEDPAQRRGKVLQSLSFSLWQTFSTSHVICAFL